MGAPQCAKSPGQATVELAFIVIMLTIMMVGTFELGRAFSAWIQVGNVARAGAQYGSIAGTMGDPDLEDVEAAALEEQSTIYGVAPAIAYDVLSDEYDYCAVSVTVTYDFSPLVTIGPIPENLSLTRSSQMRLQFVSAQMADPPQTDAGEDCR